MHVNEPRPAHWLPFRSGTTRFGWLDPDTARRLAEPPSPFGLDHRGLVLGSGAAGVQDTTQALAFAAHRLQQDGILREWRSEQLDVYGEDGEAIATIERGACRPLGIETRSVQLNAFRPDGSMLAARRASHKLSDPNRWDNLAGGMIAAGESDLQALAREAYEEGGLRLDGLIVARGERLRVQRMVAEGLMIETVQVFDVQLGADFVPLNHDGEVAAFEVFSIDAACDAIERGEFTLQASLAILDGARRSLHATPPDAQVRSCSAPET